MPDAQPQTPQVPLPLFAYSLLYGGMTCIAGVLGSKQVSLGPLAVEAGIFAFLLLVALSSAVAELYGRPTANRLVRFGFILLVVLASTVAELHGRATADRLVRLGFVPLIVSMILIQLVLALPTDPNMFEPAKAAFPIILGQSWRLMIAGICAYGVSMTLNVYLFAKMARPGLPLVAVRGAVASMLSQVVDTLIFITIAFYGVFPIGELLLGQMLAKVVLSAVLVPPLVYAFVGLGRRLDATNAK